MNRQIKFRGKERTTGEWFYGNLFDKDTNGRTHIRTTDKGSLDVDPDTVGQFTGLLDSLGKEIYEHDIVRISVGLSDEEAETNKHNAALAGVKLPSWYLGGDIIARVSFFDGAFHYIHLSSYLPKSESTTQEPMFCYLFNERHPDVRTSYQHTIEVIGNIYDNPELMKGE